MSAPIVGAEEEGSRSPNLDLAQLLHRFDHNSKCGKDVADIKQQILSIIESDSMAPFYESICAKYGWAVDESLLATMKEKNAVELEGFETKREDIVKNSGDLELLEIDTKKGRFYARIGDWTSAIAVFDEVITKPKAGTGRKIDTCFCKAKIQLFRADIKGLKAALDEAKKLMDIGGDWDRRNKLKIYEAFYSIMMRDIAKAAELFQDGIATFSSTDICSYNQFMFYAIITTVLTLPRSDLKKKIIDNAHVISVIIEAPKLQALVDSLYACDYKQLMHSLLDLDVDLLEDRYLGPHTVHLQREIRILAFAQFLEAYKSVLLSSMASSFGISNAMLDRELSHFIASGRLNAKIDKVGDVVETVKSDNRNAQYQEVIKKGDHLLNQVQKLVRVIDQ